MHIHMVKHTLLTNNHFIVTSGYPPCAYVCLSTLAWNTSVGVQVHSYRCIQCVGWRMQILHIHIILKHNAHTPGPAYPSHKQSFHRDIWIPPMCIYVSVYSGLEYLCWCTSTFISVYTMCRLAHTNTTYTHPSET
jgi:hypothetical protein